MNPNFPGGASWDAQRKRRRNPEKWAPAMGGGLGYLYPPVTQPAVFVISLWKQRSGAAGVSVSECWGH
eukprot:21238-Eustigmatos_ZCMA.PRE.1